MEKVLRSCTSPGPSPSSLISPVSSGAAGLRAPRRPAGATRACGSGRSRFPYRRNTEIFTGLMRPLHIGRAIELPQFGERKSIILVGSMGAFDWCKNRGVGDPCSGVRGGLRILCLHGPFSFNRVRPRRQEGIWRENREYLSVRRGLQIDTKSRVSGPRVGGSIESEEFFLQILYIFQQGLIIARRSFVNIIS